MSISRIEQLKIDASLLKKSVAQGKDISRMQQLPKFTDLPAETISQQAKRKDYLQVIALEKGVGSWQALIAKEEKINAFFEARQAKQWSLLYPSWGQAFTSEWHGNYADARASLDEHGGYLLVHHDNYFLVTPEYIERLGIDPQDPDWEAIGYDWAKPTDTEAFGRLLAKIKG